MTNPNYRALCAELHQCLEHIDISCDVPIPQSLIDRARAALDTEPAIGIDDCPYCTNGLVTVLRNSASYHFDGDEPIAEYEDCEECGGSGKAPPATPPAPVPAAERLPGPGDCDAEGRCWWLKPRGYRGHSISESYWILGDADYRILPSKTHWLPANALPLPGVYQ